MPATTTTVTAASSLAAPAVPSLLELEITQFCQLKCSHCYSSSGPEGGHGTMTPGDWKRVMDQAAAIGVRQVQFIGGEPALAPALPGLIRHALDTGLKVQVYSNLVHVNPELWELFSRDGVSLGTSWYAADPVTHAKITGSRASYDRTRENIAEAVRRGIPVRAAVVGILPGQDTTAAADMLRAAGVSDIRIRPQQNLGRAARRDAPHDLAELCGQCGNDRAAVLPDGTLIPCVIGRWLNCGNVQDTPLADILASPAWKATLALVPRRRPGSLNADCAPDNCPPASDGNDCPPASSPACLPAYCAPDTGGAARLPLTAKATG